MANFAQLDDDGLVLNVVVVDDEVVIREADGIAYLARLTGHATWRQSYPSGGPRKNEAEPGGSYRFDLDAFVLPRPFGSWLLDEETCKWLPPTPPPKDGDGYAWDELSLSWIALPPPPTETAM